MKGDSDPLIELYNSDKTYYEMADILGVSYGAINSRVYKALRDGFIFKRGGKKKKEARIFVFDIETSTILARVFSPKTEYINHKNIIKDWFVICWAGRWQGEKKIQRAVVTPDEARNRDDKRICLKLWDIFNEADVLVAHNGDRFDIKRMNYRWWFHDIQPPLPYRSIDTLKASRSALGATSHALDYLAKQMKIPAKLSTGFQLWIDCENGVKSALSEMDAYCCHDIEIGEQMYYKIRPWIKGGVNMGLYTELDVSVCPRCASQDIEPTDKIITTGANAYKTFRCNNCQYAGRTKESAINNHKRKKLVV